MRVLVTGGCGFIGSHIVEHHLKKGDAVHVVDDLTTGSLKNMEPFQKDKANKLTVEEANILTWENIEGAIRNTDLIYHMAAVVGIYRVLKEPVNVVATNIAGTERIFRYLVSSGSNARVLIASSSEVYGHSGKPVLHENDQLIFESAQHARWTYSISKLADEALAVAYNRILKHKPITSIRFFNTVGPRQSGRYGMVVPRFVQQACDGEPMTVFGDGSQTRCFCDVRDTVVALNALADNDASRDEIVNVGMNREVTIKELAEIVRQRANSQSEIIYIPYREAYQEEFVDIQRRKPELTKFFQLTDFKHQWNLEKTVDDLIQRYRSSKKP